VLLARASILAAAPKGYRSADFACRVSSCCSAFQRLVVRRIAPARTPYSHRFGPYWFGPPDTTVPRRKIRRFLLRSRPLGHHGRLRFLDPFELGIRSLSYTSSSASKTLAPPALRTLSLRFSPRSAAPKCVFVVRVVKLRRFGPIELRIARGRASLRVSPHPERFGSSLRSARLPRASRVPFASSVERATSSPPLPLRRASALVRFRVAFHLHATWRTTSRSEDPLAASESEDPLARDSHPLCALLPAPRSGPVSDRERAWATPPVRSGLPLRAFSPTDIRLSTSFVGDRLPRAASFPAAWVTTESPL
jgi:hypothetical protein